MTLLRKKAIVFGATGLVGRQVVTNLSEQTNFEQIIAVTRTPQPSSWWHPTASTITNHVLFDVPTGTDWTNALQQIDWLGVTDVFVCVGTTMRVAGSAAAFRHVDVDFPIAIATLAKHNDIQRFVVISSIGASVSSPFFYLKCKAEMEQAIITAELPIAHIVRPSLLIGERTEKRSGERFAIMFSNLFPWIYKGFLAKQKPITATQLSRAMIGIMNEWPVPPIPKGYDTSPSAVFFHESITLHHKSE